MSRYEVIQATRAEESLVAYLMTLAFGSDPVARWVWPDPKVYKRVSRVYQAVWWKGVRSWWHACRHGSAFCRHVAAPGGASR